MVSVGYSDLHLLNVREYVGTKELEDDFLKIEKYIDWPLLVVFKLSPNLHV